MKQSSSDGNLYYFNCEGKIIILDLYVDDLFITRNFTKKIDFLRHELEQKFDMTSSCLCSKYVGMYNSIIVLTAASCISWTMHKA